MSSYLIYGLTDKNELVTINDVERGLKCNCRCINCKVKLIARKGDVREHHFAHYNSEDCLWRGESLYHKKAKEIIEKSNKIILPKLYWSIYPEVIIYDEKTIGIDSVLLEKKIDDFIPDIIIETKGRQLLIEIFYSHAVGYLKYNKIRKKNIPTIEININPIVEKLLKNKDFFMESHEFEDFILNNTYYKNWIYNPEKIRLENILRNKYTIKYSINSFEYYNEIYGFREKLIYTEDCPLKKREWKSGQKKGEIYAKYDKDCIKCDYFMGTGLKKTYNDYDGSLIQQDDAVLCIGHMKSTFDLDIIIALNKHKKNT